METDVNNNHQDEFAAFIGIDWAARKHVFALYDGTADRIEVAEIEHTPEAVDAWAMELSRRFGERPIAVALEQVRGALVFMLAKYQHLVIFPIHPAMLANYRKSFRPSGLKGIRMMPACCLIFYFAIATSCDAFSLIHQEREHSAFW
ncbi:MAG TPA: transposase [Bryobacteraceae bacterium]|jgi:hypothetical protein